MEDVSDREEYYKEWYEKNRENVLKGRREKYRDDPEYAKRCRDAAKSYRARAKRLGKKPRGRRGPVQMMVSGVPRQAFPISYLAERIERSVSTVNNWSRGGSLPETPLRTGGGMRLYTDGMIEVVREHVEEWGKVPEFDKKFRDGILDGWKQIGIKGQKRKK